LAVSVPCDQRRTPQGEAMGLALNIRVGSGRVERRVGRLIVAPVDRTPLRRPRLADLERPGDPRRYIDPHRDVRCSRQTHSHGIFHSRKCRGSPLSKFGSTADDASWGRVRACTIAAREGGIDLIILQWLGLLYGRSSFRPGTHIGLASHPAVHVREGGSPSGLTGRTLGQGAWRAHMWKPLPVDRAGIASRRKDHPRSQLSGTCRKPRGFRSGQSDDATAAGGRDDGNTMGRAPPPSLD
jgi:hypothetical protein